MKIFTLRNTGIAILLTLLLVFSGCSSSTNETSTGGGASSPGAGSGSPSNGVQPSSLAGTYTGTATATASALGLSESETVPVTIVIDQNGRVTIQSGSEIFTGVITMNGNSFSQSQTFNNEDFGSVKCSGTLTLQGSIDNNDKITATLSSQSVICNVNGVNIPGTVTGTLTAAKQG
ncbi:hypothetical protein BMS3Abin11_01126 [bacterium BMS3Abin11]|nr:hypothetical protein BMS3Abin11_01126 [bacterium BMS3Abin11]HDH08683.1 hypothetical protein [Gammaproteobacteria bacterium]